jgi:hypothetical protein
LFSPDFRGGVRQNPRTEGETINRQDRDTVALRGRAQANIDGPGRASPAVPPVCLDQINLPFHLGGAHPSGRRVPIFRQGKVIEAMIG